MDSVFWKRQRKFYLVYRLPAVGKIKLFYMSFTPTKQQLEELGFEYGNVRCQLQIDKPPFDIWLSYGWGFFIQIGDENRKIYPQSIEDIQTLIKILTPTN